ncbi:NAD-dependent epimerase/dehydratase family protein [Devosia sp. ZW T5_3]|uniref:NAD-dependent epimerase/dehydratase family protein n=1 Tax=Devosia sp. ZW T5_3 TaxID=3378085 RepID=UPI003851B537
MDRVLVTGISGFLGGHVALQLLNSGYFVRGSVRNLSKATKVRDTLARAGSDVSRLEVVELDLLSDAGWDAAMKGVRYLQHTASPFSLETPKDPQDLIRPAVGGTERALNSALAADVERIVLTSSTAAITYGHPQNRRRFSSDDWTQLEGGQVPAYQQSKALAERRAWAIMDAAGRHGDLAVINPSGIFGPLLDEDPGTSAQLVSMLLGGRMPVLPRLGINPIDVRDVAEAHLRAMTASEAGGRRHPMAVNGYYLADAARILRQHYSSRRVPTALIPDWLVRLAAIAVPMMRPIVDELGEAKMVDTSAALSLLNRPFVTADDAILATAESLIANGIV